MTGATTSVTGASVCAVAVPAGPAQPVIGRPVLAAGAAAAASGCTVLATVVTTGSPA
jgi:hypothetical protein